MTFLLVGIGGFLGAIARYALDSAIGAATGGAHPWGTFAINISGSFALGVLFALVTDRGILPPDIRPLVMVGFIGAFTTFSTWMLESWRLVEQGAYAAAALNLGGSVILGLGAVILGLSIGRAL